MQGVEQFANKEASGHRFVAWVIGHFGWSYDRDIQPIDLTGDIGRRVFGAHHAVAPSRHVTDQDRYDLYAC